MRIVLLLLGAASGCAVAEDIPRTSQIVIEELGGAAGNTASSGGAVAHSQGGAASGGQAIAAGGYVSAGGSSGVGGDKTAGSGGAAALGGAAGGGATASGGRASSTGGASNGGALVTGGRDAFGGTSGAGVGGSAAVGGSPAGGSSAQGGASGGSTGVCAGKPACLLHRYTFDGTGTTVVDSVGSSDGTAANTTLANGEAALAGGTSDQYISFPSGLISSLSNVSVEAWITWSGGSAWQRIFDFGDNSSGVAGEQGSSGSSYLMLAPMAANSSGHLRAAWTLNGNTAETQVEAATALPTSSRSHVAVVIDTAAKTFSLYMNGQASGSTAFQASLSALRDQNNWLGRSQFKADPDFGGKIHEFRIYGSARSAAQVQASYTAGPDQAPSD